MKTPRLYSLFFKQGRYWDRISSGAFRKDLAIRYYQNILLAASFRGVRVELRPVKNQEVDLVAIHNFDLRMNRAS